MKNNRLPVFREIISTLLICWKPWRLDSKYRIYWWNHVCTEIKWIQSPDFSESPPRMFQSPCEKQALLNLLFLPKTEQLPVTNKRLTTNENTLHPLKRNRFRSWPPCPLKSVYWEKFPPWRKMPQHRRHWDPWQTSAASYPDSLLFRPYWKYAQPWVPQKPRPTRLKD